MKFLMLLMVSVLVAVTAAREVALFTSFTTTDRDWLLAAAFGLALVLAKPLLASAAARVASNNPALAVACGLLIVPLMLISVAGTALYFESAFQARSTADQQSSTGYQVLNDVIRQKQASAAQLKDIAAANAKKGHHWNAGEQLKQAAAIEAELPDLIARLNEQQQNTSAASIGGHLLQQWRWLVWVAVAVIADLLQVVGVMVLAAITTEQNKTAKQNSRNRTRETEQSEQPEQSKKQTGEQKQPAKTPRTEQAGGWLAEQISRTGQLPTVRDAKAAGVTYAGYSQQIQQLLDAGIIQQKTSGKGWEVRN